MGGLVKRCLRVGAFCQSRIIFLASMFRKLYGIMHTGVGLFSVMGGVLFVRNDSVSVFLTAVMVCVSYFLLYPLVVSIGFKEGFYMNIVILYGGTVSSNSDGLAFEALKASGWV